MGGVLGSSNSLKTAQAVSAKNACSFRASIVVGTLASSLLVAAPVEAVGICRFSIAIVLALRIC